MANSNTTSTQLSANLPISKGENYERWIVQMYVIFKFQDVSEIVNEGVSSLKENADDVQQVAHKKQRKKDGKKLCS